jgi:hypothetical protein
LADARAAEGKAQGPLQKIEISARKAQTESSAVRIDLTMLQSRMKAIKNNLIMTKNLQRRDFGWNDSVSKRVIRGQLK